MSSLRKGCGRCGNGFCQSVSVCIRRFGFLAKRHCSAMRSQMQGKDDLQGKNNVRGKDNLRDIERSENRTNA